MRTLCIALLAALFTIAPTAAYSSSTWLTLAGDPADPATDYIQFNPGSLAQDQGSPTLAVRVSRVRPRTSKEGIVFRSFESVVAVDCARASARFLRASFYDEPDFKGIPFRTVVFGPADVRPMAFREIQGAPTERMVRAACKHSAVQSVG